MVCLLSGNEFSKKDCRSHNRMRLQRKRSITFFSFSTFEIYTGMKARKTNKKGRLNLKIFVARSCRTTNLRWNIFRKSPAFSAVGSDVATLLEKLESNSMYEKKLFPNT